MRWIAVWLIDTAALFVLPYLMPSIVVRSFGVALLAALVLGLVNALVRPVLALLTLPAAVLTLGLFILVINGLMFWLASGLVPGFHVAGLGSAIGGALLYSIISWALSTLFLKK
ncbi:MAG: phage holin family protein [Oxalobacter formigenes]|nr:phage holin family protein [Oxalobacter formigenes]MCM1280511.1 phage holin family protein [Alistipes senegalensis]MCM1513070.1 phage holin family protein [Oxalobacter formigenes]